MPDCVGSIAGVSLPTFAVVEEVLQPVPSQTDLDLICDQLDNRRFDLETRIYHPDPLPTQRLPLMVFTHGNGQDAGSYDYLMNAIAALGFVVISIESGDTNTVRGREESIACALSWIGWDDPLGGKALLDGHLTCDLIVAGHSNGGQGAWQFVRDRVSDPIIAAYMFGFDVKALVTLAPRHANVPGLGSPGVLAPEIAVPLLSVLAGEDEQIFLQGLAQYDASPREEVLAADASLRVLRVVHGANHNNFGGTGTGIPVASSPATFTARDSVTQFLEWQILQRNAQTNRRALFGEQFSEELSDPTLWTGEPGYGELSGSQPCSATFDPGACDARYGCAWRGGSCVDRPLVFSTHGVDQAEATTGRLPVTAFPTLPLTSGFSGQVQLAAASDLTSDLNFGTDHDTSVMRVDWGNGADGDIQIVAGDILAPLDVSSYSYLNIRLANLRSSPADPMVEADCELDQPPVQVGARLLDGDPDTLQATLGPLPPQDSWAMIGTMGVTGCSGRQAMTTIRVPMSQFCEPGFNASDLRQIELSFADPGFDARVFVDSIEFTRNQYDDDPDGDGTPENLCPVASAAWACEATQGLNIKTTSCQGVPDPGKACSRRITEFGVAPQVSYAGSMFNGWVVHSPPGSIRDPLAPTAADLAWIEARCAVACETQYESDPDTGANCGDAGVFLQPTFLESPDIGPFTLIEDDRLDGSGIFVGESLSCSLHDSCCLEFDENVCIAKPERVTPSGLAIGTGEEFIATINSSAGTINGGGPDVGMVGSVGYSRCKPGAAECPFYIGSLDLAAVAPVPITVQCSDGTVENHAIDNLQIGLLQPAFGIAQADGDEVGFPAGSLVFEGTFDIAALPQHLVGGSEIDVTATVDANQFLASGVHIEGAIPCSGGVGTVTGTFDLGIDLGGAVIASPPSVTINTPALTLCGRKVPLSATISDPDGDHVETRWYVDDVLIHPSIGLFVITGPRTLRVVATDARGAATTTIKPVSCISF